MLRKNPLNILYEITCFRESCLENFLSYRPNLPSYYFNVLDINQCMCLPKAELNTKNEPKRPPLCGRLGSFLVFNSVH